TDYIQHTYAPGTPEADRYYQNMDALFGRLDALGAVVGIVSDHGMREKANTDGSLKAVWLQDELHRAFGARATTVICPLTDYFVAHHGALGSFVRVYCRGVAPEEVMRLARSLPGIEAVHDKAAAARLFDLPPDREGDVVVISDGATCIGTTPAAHDV